MNSNRVALYTRVSTRGRKRGRKQRPENQIRKLRAFAKTQAWKIVSEFTDQESGAKGEKDRPQLKAMFAAASKREFDVLLFWSLDRFSREGIVPTLLSLKRLTDYGIRWRSLEEPFLDTTTSEFGDLIAAFIAKIAELERKRIQRRILAGLERAKAEGKVLGRPRRVLDVQKISEMRKAGMTYQEIGKKLKCAPALAFRRLKESE